MAGRTHVEEVWGMAVSIDVRDDLPDIGAAFAAVVTWLHYVDEVFSTYRLDSVVSRLSRGDLALADTPPSVRSVMTRCEELCVETDGYFDAWADGSLDPSGVVKGWAVDVASDLLLEAGAANHCVNAGGDIRARGEPVPGRPWTFGIAHPLVRDAVCAVLAIGEGALATSGTAERGLHVLDPHTGRPAIDLASVTVSGPDLTTADAYATAALAMGMAAPEWLAGLAGYEAMIIDAGGYLWQTDGLSALAVPSLQ